VKLLSWNVNGIRACARKGFVDWLTTRSADVVCVQETRAEPDQLGDELLRPGGYRSYWHSAQKKGYSGVATYTKRRPSRVIEGLGIPRFDREGRVLVTEFRSLAVINAYFPNTQHDHARLRFKLEFCRAIRRRMDAYRAEGRNVVLCGDYNIAHSEIDLARPKENKNNAGFLPQERGWMDRFVRAGYVDTFRARCNEPGHYTWWSQRFGVRERNIGWRLDYFFVNPDLKRRVRDAFIESEVRGSDHCPVGLGLR
jgi:exodeoxyribonuclease-3